MIVFIILQSFTVAIQLVWCTVSSRIIWIVVGNLSLETVYLWFLSDYRIMS
jgi:hypothetical protein